MADLGWPEMLTIGIIAIALFGWKRLPDVSRSVGRSIRIFRSEIKGAETDTTQDAAPSADITGSGLGGTPPDTAGER